MIGLIFQKELILIKQMHKKKKSDICLYWYFKDIGSKCEPYHSYGCYDLMQKAISFHDVAIVNVQGSAYRIHFWYKRKNDAFRIINNSNLVHKKAVSYFVYLYI